MISFKDIMRQVLTETMSFKQLWNASDSARKRRAAHVRPKEMSSRSVEAPDSWVFSYKSDPGWSTTGKRWHGFVKLLKEGRVNQHAVEIQDLDCMVECDCPDYRYRFAYGNTQQGASETGAKSWNQNNGAYPRVMGERTGLCKHLMSLVEYLGTKIEPDAPQPDDEPPKKVASKKPLLPPKEQPRPSDQKSTSDAPDPDDSYSDSRGDADTGTDYSDGRELQENRGSVSERLTQFVRANPIFEVPYYDTE